jgi:uncharacterized protein (TIGR01777 family)
MLTILLAGGTGLIGTELQKFLREHGYRVVVLSRAGGKRKDPNVKSLPENFFWDPSQNEIDREAIEQADVIINLAGAGVADQRWTRARKKEIAESRVNSGKLIVKALSEIPNRVKLVINASGIGWYGADPSIPNPHPFTEDMPPDDEFLGITCKAWEDSIQPVAALGKRLVIFRTGIVLTTKGGALAEFLKPLQWGVAGILGSGRQIISWIHIHDLCRLFLFAIQHDNIQGVYNAVSPQPVSNKELTIKLAQKKRGRFYIPLYVPSFVLKLILGEMSVEVLKSATVSSRKIEQEGFAFNYENIDAAFHELLVNKPSGL